MTFLRAKYSQKVPDVIVAAGEEAIDFLLRNRAELFPLAPIVHMGVAKSFLRQELPLPPMWSASPSTTISRHDRTGSAMASADSATGRGDRREFVGPDDGTRGAQRCFALQGSCDGRVSRRAADKRGAQTSG